MNQDRAHYLLISNFQVEKNGKNCLVSPPLFPCFPQIPLLLLSLIPLNLYTHPSQIFQFSFSPLNLVVLVRFCGTNLKKNMKIPPAPPLSFCCCQLHLASLGTQLAIYIMGKVYKITTMSL